MFCGKCGAQAEDNAKFCGKCGAAFENIDVPTENKKDSTMTSKKENSITMNSEIENDSVKTKKVKKKGSKLRNALIATVTAVAVLGTSVFAIPRIMPESIKNKITNNGLFKDKESKEIEKAYYHIFTDVIPAGGSVPVVKIVGEHYESNMPGMDKGIEYINPAYYGYEDYLPAEETYGYLLKVGDIEFGSGDTVIPNGDEDLTTTYTYKPGTEYEDPFLFTWTAYLEALNDVCKMNGMVGDADYVLSTQGFDMFQIMRVSDRLKCQTAQDETYQEFMNMEYLLWYMTYMKYKCNVTSEKDDYGTLVHININNIDMMRLLYEELLKTSELISSNNITEAKLEMAKQQLGNFIQKEKDNMSTMYTTKRKYILDGPGIYQVFNDTDVKFGSFDVTKRNIGELGLQLVGNYVFGILMQREYDKLCNNGTMMSITLANMAERIKKGDYETVNTQLSFYAFKDEDGQYRIPYDVRTAEFIPEGYEEIPFKGNSGNAYQDYVNYQEDRYEAGVRGCTLSSFYLGDDGNWAESLQGKGILKQNYLNPNKLEGYDSVHSVGINSRQDYENMMLWVIMGYRGDTAYKVREPKSDRLGIKETPEERAQRLEAEENAQETKQEATSKVEDVATMPNISDLEVGKSVYFGNYKDADIRWEVLSIDGNYAVLTTKYIIDYQPFSNYNSATQDIRDALGEDAVAKHYANASNQFNTKQDDWYCATLRGWLNSKFIKEAFTEEERERIVDEITIFNKSLLEKYFPYESDRTIDDTLYAMGRHGEFVGYWLQDGTFVNASEGKYRSTPLGGVESRGGVRPIIVVNFGK